MSTIAFSVPMKTAPGLNAREHWGAKARRVKNEKAVALLAAKSAINGAFKRAGFGFGLAAPYAVSLTRLRKGGGPLLDDDNLVGSLKAVRDAVAEALGEDDGDRARIRFECREKRAKEWGVEVEIVGPGLTTQEKNIVDRWEADRASRNGDCLPPEVPKPKPVRGGK